MLIVLVADNNDTQKIVYLYAKMPSLYDKFE